MKITNGVLFLIFTSFALVNLNDPDPVLWVVIYGTVALTCLLRIFNMFFRGMTMILMILIGLYALVHLPYFLEWLNTPNKSEIFDEMVYEKLDIEGTREFLGLVLADLTLAFQLYWKRV